MPRIVQCSEGHLFMTEWVPGVSLKSVRWFNKRFQRCPVGKHWSWVERVDAAALTDDERNAAMEYPSTGIP